MMKQMKDADQHLRRLVRPGNIRTMAHSRMQKRPKVKSSMIRQSLDSSLFLFLGIVGLFGLVMLLCVEPQSWEVLQSVDDMRSLSNSKTNHHKDNFSPRASSDRENNKPRFVFVMGLENSGHELLQELAMMSPGLKRLQELDIHPRDTQTLGNLLYHKESYIKNQKKLTREAIKTQKSLAKKKDKDLKLNLNDTVHRSTLVQIKDQIRGLSTRNKMKLLHDRQPPAQVNYDVPSLWGSPCHRGNERHDLTNVQQDLIRILQTIEKKAQNNASTKMTTTMTTPVNILFNIIKSVNGNVLSYPHLTTGQCRPLQYPNLDVWYDVCEKAGVVCSHVYIHRKDPYQILLALAKSRNYDAKILRSIQIYTNMLNTMHMQMSLNAEKTLGCIDLFDEEYKTASNVPSWKDQVANLMGWASSPNNDYADMFEQAHNSSLEEQWRQNTMMAETDLIPPTIRAYFDSMAKANDRARELCQRIVRRRIP